MAKIEKKKKEEKKEVKRNDYVIYVSIKIDGQNWQHTYKEKKGNSIEAFR